MFSNKYSEILKNTFLITICEQLLMTLEVRYFVDISYENASFGVLEDFVWLDLIYFLTTIAFWLIKYLFRIDGDNLGVLVAKDLTLQYLSLRSAIMKNSRHCTKLISIVLQLTNQIK